MEFLAAATVLFTLVQADFDLELVRHVTSRVTFTQW